MVRTEWRRLVDDAVKKALKPYEHHWLPMRTIVQLVEAQLPALGSLPYPEKSKTVGQVTGKKGLAFPQRRCGTVNLYYIKFPEGENEKAELHIKINPKQLTAYIPKIVVKTLGFTLKATVGRYAMVLYPENADLGDVVKSVELLLADLKLAASTETNLSQTHFSTQSMKLKCSAENSANSSTETS